MRWSDFVCVVMAAVAVVVLALLGATKSLGAHPFWDVKVALYGVGPGAVVGLVLLRRIGLGLLVASGLLLLSGAAAWWGKAAFAASYAENALAGRAWFFGWIGICGSLVALLALIAISVGNRSKAR